MGCGRCGAQGGGVVKLAATGYYDEPGQVVAGDDGSVQAGVPLTYPRFVDNGNGTVTDTVTGLVWLKQANCLRANWAEAVAAVQSLASGQCGLTDGSAAGAWRMPNRNEMQSLEDRMENNHADFLNATYVWRAERRAVPGADLHELCGERILLDVDDGCRRYERGVGGVQLRLRRIRLAKSERRHHAGGAIGTGVIEAAMHRGSREQWGAPESDRSGTSWRGGNYPKEQSCSVSNPLLMAVKLVPKTEMRGPIQ
jgi:hypothetical protein